MSRIAYVNGQYRPLRHAKVHVEDRGYQFADGVYEVVYCHGGRMVDEALHLERLARSLRELAITPPVSDAALRAILGEVARRNRLVTGLIYIQVTRGSAPRFHAFPPAGTRPGLVVTMRQAPALPASLDHWRAAAITLPDERWARCDIKSVGLLPNILAKEKARQAGAAEAILYDRDGLVTEGASSSVFMVTRHGELLTRPLSNAILPGCTRAALLEELTAAGLVYEERAFTRDELLGAAEIFLTSATSFVKPITSLDGQPVGDGQPGPVAKRLFAMVRGHICGTATHAAA